MEPRKVNKILGVIIVLLVIAVAYLLMKQNDATPELAADTTQITATQTPAVVSNTVAPDLETELKADDSDSSTWLEYANTKYAFEFKRPKTWTLANCPSCEEPDTQANSIAFSNPADYYANFNVDVVAVTNCSTVKACAEANRKEFSSEQSSTGLKAYELGSESGYMETISRPNSGDWKYEVYYFLKNKNLYTVSLQTKIDDEEKAMPGLKEILSTFKMTTVGEISLKTYSDKMSGFSIGYPSDGHTVVGGPRNGIKITNVAEEVGLKYAFKAGDYYIEVYVEDKPLDCAKTYASSRKITVDGVEGFRGPAKSEIKNMYPYALCFPNRDGKGYLVSVVEYDERQDRPKSILDSFHFVD